MLERNPGVVVVAEAADGREALALIDKHRPDVVLMDIGMASLNGMEAMLQAARRHPQVRVIIVSMHKNEEYIVQAIRAGAAGYLYKDAAASELEQAIQTVARGERYLSAEAARCVADYEARFGLLAHGNSDPKTARTELTPREREVLQLIAEGRTTAEIANILHISIKTVETHRYRLMNRLNIHHVTGLVRYAMKVGLVQAEQ